MPLFRIKPPQRRAAGNNQLFKPADPSTGYDPHLADRIRLEHAELLAVFRRLLDAAASARLEQVTQDLVLFRQTFARHLEIENVKFYAYMDRRLADSPREQQALHARRREANHIARTVADFIHIWVTVAPTDLTLPAFAEQLKVIGTQLVQRIEMEEGVLLPMYSA